MTDVAAYLQVSSAGRTDATGGEAAEAHRVDKIGPLWEPTTIEPWAEREWVGH